MRFNPNRYYCLATYDTNGQTLNDGHFSSKEGARKWAGVFKSELYKGEDYTATLYEKNGDDLVRDEYGNAIPLATWHFHPTKTGQTLTIRKRNR